MKQANIELGRNMVEKECKRRGVSISDLLKPDYYEGMLQKYGFTALEDIFGSVGYGGMAAMYVVARLIEEQRAKEPVAPVKLDDLPAQVEQRVNQSRANHGIIMIGNEDLDIPVRFAKCCSPVPGDEIVGYITRGRGVTIHKAECINAIHGEEERKVEVDWADNSTGTFYATIKVVAYDHVSLLGELATYIGEMNVPIKAISASVDEKTQTSAIRLTIEVRSRDQVDKVMKQLRKKSDVIDVYRVQG